MARPPRRRYRLAPIPNYPRASSPPHRAEPRRLPARAAPPSPGHSRAWPKASARAALPAGVLVISSGGGLAGCPLLARRNLSGRFTACGGDRARRCQRLDHAPQRGPRRDRRPPPAFAGADRALRESRGAGPAQP
jgi:hypothetical protein